jgi:hypothetical protein
METIHLIDEYVAVTPGEPYRLFPFGRIVKNGKVRDLTRELAAKFKLPHFKPPIKLGSHAETTPAGGHIIGLEVREDGLYAIPEYTDSGMSTLVAGSYRYHSPEIVWEGGYEHPTTGELIAGPLVVGDALLHAPHMGEATALYSIEPVSGGTHMSENTVTVPAGLWEKFLARLFADPAPIAPEPAPPPAQPEQSDDYAAQVQELSARLQAVEDEKANLLAAAALKERVNAFAAELKGTTLAEDVELFGVLANLPEDAAKAIAQRIKGLSAQAAAANLTSDIGSSGDNALPVDKFNAAVNAKMAAGMSRNEAVTAVATEAPDLIKAVQGGK